MATAKKKQEESADNIDDTMDGESDLEDESEYKDYTDNFKEFKENNNDNSLCAPAGSNLPLHESAMLGTEQSMAGTHNMPQSVSTYGNTNGVTSSNDLLSAHVQRMTSQNSMMNANMADMYMPGANHSHLLSAHLGGLHTAQ